MVSDSSTMYFYDDNGKLVSSTYTWYEMGFEHGKTENHSKYLDVTTVIYDNDENPIKGTHQMYYNGNMQVEDVNYENEDNGDYATYVDKNRNGKLDDNEYAYYYDKKGNYLSDEEFAARHPSKTDQPAKTDQPTDVPQEKESFWDKAVNWFKGLFN